MNSKILSALLLTIVFCPHLRSEITIGLFQEDRDMPAIKKILDQYPEKLRYESMGREQGTTKAYLTSPKYNTKVLRVDDETIGFINYTVIEPPFLLKWLMARKGYIHLLGVNSRHQFKGYGNLLLNHALEELKSKNLSNATLTVKRENVGACKFYEKEGFKCATPETVRASASDLVYEKNL